MKVEVGVFLLFFLIGVSQGQDESKNCTKGSDCGRGQCCVKAESEPGTCQAYKAKGQSCIVSTNKLRWRKMRSEAVVDCPCQKKQGNLKLFCKANGTSVQPQGPAGTCEPRPKRGRGNRKGKGGKGKGGRRNKQGGRRQGGANRKGNRKDRRKARQERRRQRAQAKGKSTQ